MLDHGADIFIVFADDDEDDRAFFREAIEQLGANIRCETANDGLDLFECLLTCTKLPDFIFLDLNMPRQDGKECLRQLKQDKRYEHIPVIIYSTSGIEDEVQKMMQLGAAHYIKKPTFFNDIKNALQLVIGGEKDV
jgi:CheY-like chemotaxis protein